MFVNMLIFNEKTSERKLIEAITLESRFRNILKVHKTTKTKNYGKEKLLQLSSTVSFKVYLSVM